MVNLHVSLVSTRIIIPVHKIRVNPCDTQECFPIHPPLPPPFQEGAQFAWVFKLGMVKRFLLKAPSPRRGRGERLFLRRG